MRRGLGTLQKPSTSPRRRTTRRPTLSTTRRARASRLEADVLEAVDHVRRTGHTVPWAEDGVRPLARRVLEEHEHLALQDEEDLLDLVRVRRVALARGDEHDAQREVLRRNRRGVRLAGRARADEPMLRAPKALH